MKKISVVITSYCGSDNLARAIDSVLNQTYKELEVIVVDDNDPNSEERKKTQLVMDKYKDKEQVRYIKHPKNLNGSVARNTGIDAANGYYIQLLDDDDYLFPQKLELSVKALEKNPLCTMVVTGSIACNIEKIVDLSGAVEDSSNCIISKEWLYRFNALGTGSNIFATKESITSLNCFDVSYPRMQDIEFIFRYCMKYTVCSIKDRLIIKHINNRPIKVNTYRKHEKVLSKFITQFKPEIIRLLGNDQANRWFESQASHLFRIAVGEGDKKCIRDAARKLEQYRHLTNAERLKCAFPSVWIMIKSNPFLVKLKYKKEFNSSALEEKLTDQERFEYERFRKIYL